MTALFMGRILCCVQKMTFHNIPSHPSALKWFPPLLPQCSMSLDRVVDEYDPVTDEPLEVTNS